MKHKKIIYWVELEATGEPLDQTKASEFIEKLKGKTLYAGENCELVFGMTQDSFVIE